jgi:hypothetical protein
MNKHGIAKLRRELEQLRVGKYNLKSSDLTRFAAKVGRKRDTSRGKEPTYVSILLPGARPLSIPGHRKIKPYTADAIMDILEADLDRWEELLEEKEAKANEKSKRLPPATIRTNRNPSGT